MNFTMSGKRYFKKLRLTVIFCVLLNASNSYAVFLGGPTGPQEFKNQGQQNLSAPNQMINNYSPSNISNQINSKINNTTSQISNQVNNQINNTASQIQNAAGLTELNNTLSSLKNSLAGLQQSTNNLSQSLNSNTTNGANGLTRTSQPGDNFNRFCDTKTYDVTTGQNNVAMRPDICDKVNNNLRMGVNFPDESLNPDIVSKSPGDNGDTKVSVSSGKQSWLNTYNSVLKATNTGLEAWLDPNHEIKDSAGMPGPLIPMTASGDVKAVDSSGAPRDVVSIKYKTNGQALSDGACQMISTPNGPYNFTAMKDGTYQLQGFSMAPYNGTRRTISGPTPKPSQPITGQIKGDTEAILDLSHPFAPRNQPDWQDRVSAVDMGLAAAANEVGSGMSGGSSSGSSSGMQGASQKMQAMQSLNYNYTYVCGHKELKNAYVFTTVTPWTRKEAWVGGFDYYKQPIIDHNGLILVNNTSNPPLAQESDKNRDGKFNGAFPTTYVKYYAECVAICTAASGGYGSAYCQEYCKKVGVESAEHELCRKFILPPVTPINRLKMAYNLAPEGPGSASSPSSGGASGMAGGPPMAGGLPSGPGGNTEPPFIYEENRAGTNSICNPQANSAGVQYTDEGMSFYCANPPQLFGYNMPPLKNWSTGLPGSKTAVLWAGEKPYPPAPDPTGGFTPDKALENLKPWRLAIVGVNSRYKPDESNDMNGEAHNMSAQYGGWNELKLYQNQCRFLFGLDCICDWQKNFWSGTSMGYVAFRSGSDIIIDNEQKTREQPINVATPGGYEAYARNPFVLAEDMTNRAHLNRVVPISRDDFYFLPASPRQLVGGVPWPGTTPAGTITGLSNAKKGDIAFLKQDNRPDQAIFVERVYGDGCLGISTADNGTQFNALGVSENWGTVTSRKICPSSGGQIAGTDDITGVPLVNKLPDCTFPNFAECADKKWDNYSIYRWKGEQDPNTGLYNNEDLRGFKPDNGQPI